MKIISKYVIQNTDSVLHLTKILQRAIQECKNKEEKYRGMCLKYLISNHQKMIENPKNILVFINYSNKKFDILQKLSIVTPHKKFNHLVYEYFSIILESLMIEHKKNFKNAMASCYDRDDLGIFLSQYPLVHDLYVQKFDLNIIHTVKNICNNANTPESFERIANKYLRNNDANIKKALFTSLFESPVTSKIWEAMRKAQTTYHFFQCMKLLKEIPETNKMATMIFQLVVIFLRGGKNISFNDLEISLNFAPDHLRNHTIRIITHKLQNDINYKLETFLQQNISANRKWKKLLRLLNGKQYLGAQVKVFQYSPLEFTNKLQKISGSEGDIEKIVEHEFREDKIPSELKNLIIAKHTQQNLRQEINIDNFCEDLASLLEDKILCLWRPLTNLLQAYGKVNFASEGSILTGYDLSNTISMFYRNPARTIIELPHNLNTNIATLLEDCINEERARQLKKN